MNKVHVSLLFRICLCLTFTGIALYAYIEGQNEITELRKNIPQISAELKTIREENATLQYEIDRFESPIHLMELARKPEFGHLKYPSLDKVIVLPEEGDKR